MSHMQHAHFTRAFNQCLMQLGAIYGLLGGVEVMGQSMKLSTDLQW